MKISFFMPVAALFTATMLFSCGDMSMPESVSIKSSGAKYSIPLGGSSFKIAEKFSADKVQSALGGDDTDSSRQKINVYEFNPTKKDDALIEFIMSYPVESQALTSDAWQSFLDNPNTMAIDAFIASHSDGGLIKVPLNKFNSKLDTGINFKAIADSFSSSDDDGEDKKDYGKIIFNKIGFANIEAFAYIKVDGIGENNSGEFKGKIEVDNDDTENLVKYTISDSSERTGNCFKSVKVLPDLKELDKNSENETDDIIEDDSFLQPEAYSTDLNKGDAGDESNLTKFINGKEENGELVKNEKCIISYEFEPTLCFASADELKAFLQNPNEIVVNVNIILRFPLNLKVISDIVIDDVLDVVGNAVEDDLMNRDDGEESDFLDYVDLVESMGFDYKLVNTSGLGLTAELLSNEIDGKTFFKDKQLKFDAEKNGFNFSKDEIVNIFKYSPFQPKIKTVIQKTDESKDSGYLKITRDAEFGVWGIFKATLNGTAKIWSKEDDSE